MTDDATVIFENRPRWPIVYAIIVGLPCLTLAIAVLKEGVHPAAILSVLAIPFCTIAAIWFAVRAMSRRSPVRVSLRGEILVVERPALWGRGGTAEIPLAAITCWGRFRQRTAAGTYEGLRFEHAGAWYRLVLTNARFADMAVLERLAAGARPAKG